MSFYTRKEFQELFREAIDAVNLLNEEIYNQNNDDELAYVHLECYDNEIFIYFLDQEIWRSDEDDREEIEIDLYEPLIDFLKRETMIMIDKIKVIKL